MNPETKQCQNCQQNFIIEPEDFVFYEKIKVPAPTWCPECRMIRRLSWQNMRTFYKRKCDLCNKDIISLYSSNVKFPIYCPSCWWSDKWDAGDYNQEYDFSNNFFQQFQELINKILKISLWNGNNNVNCEYSNNAWYSKNCYLSIFVGESDNCNYCNFAFKSKDVFDSIWVMKSENIYCCIDCQNSYNVFFGQNINNCLDSYFLYDCRNCQNCFSCVNLRNKKYCIFNKQYNKEEYFQEIKKFDFGDYRKMLEFNDKFENQKMFFLRQKGNFINCVNVTGNNIANSKDCLNCFDIEGGVENCKNIICAGLGLKDSYDIYNGGTNSQLFYDSINVGDGQKLLFSHSIFYGSSNIYYSNDCYSSSSNLFGCVGLRHKQYCILNKQYSKEEYEKLVPKIIEHMNTMPYIDKKGRVYKYGEFFPPELSPFAYNETIAQEYFPLTKEEALEQGYQWKESEQRDIKIDVKTEDLPDHIKDVKDDIINQIIECANSPSQISKRNLGGQASQCTTAFKIIQPELDFYRKMNLPLPRLCPNCRHYQRLKQRNPLKLWKRQCQCAGAQSDNKIYQNTITHTHNQNHCENEFQTTYSPDRPEIVYCEECYKAEVI